MFTVYNFPDAYPHSIRLERLGDASLLKHFPNLVSDLLPHHCFKPGFYDVPELQKDQEYDTVALRQFHCL